MNPHFFTHLLRPLKGGAPSLIVIFAIGLTLAEKAGLFGLWIGVILSSWYWKYAFILFDYTVRGVAEPPALDIQMVNPVDEQRPMAQLCILAAMYGVCHLLALKWGALAASLTAAMFCMALPASIAVLGLEGNVFRALYPPALVHVAVSLRWGYALILAMAVLYGLGVTGLFELDLWRPLQLATALFMGLSLFSLLAGSLYDRRDELGIEVWHSPEKKQAKADAEDLVASQKTVDVAYGQMRAAQHVAAWKTLANWLDSRQHRPDDYEWLIGRVTPWPDGRYLTRVTEECIDRLLTANRNGDALRVAGLALRHDAQFRPKSAASTLRLAQIAATGGAPKLARGLIADYGQRFPDDPNIKAADALAQRLGAP